MTTGSQFFERGDLAAAERAFRAALAVQPDLTPARFNLGVIFRIREENEAAFAMFTDVLATGEILAESYNNLGILASRREEYDAAVGHFRRAIDQQYQFPLAHFNLGTLLLRLGQWEEGLREYEWRWQTPTFSPLRCPQPMWDGAALDGTLLVHTEQGIGDVFQFARFIPMIRERCRRMILILPEHLDCMFPVGKWADEIRGIGEISLDAFQAVLPLMSAPFVLKISADQLPCAENYLTPKPRNADLGPLPVSDPKLKVGFAWCGSRTHDNDAFRSTKLTTFAPLFEIPDIAFYSLQIAPQPHEVRQLEKFSSVTDLSSAQCDFADTAAIVRQLDLVITVDTAILHLCGGLSLPVWGLLSRRSDWRWLGNDRTDSRWYRTLRLFRQAKLNDWDELIQRVLAELIALT